jgi:hypothetical protein
MYVAGWAEGMDGDFDERNACMDQHFACCGACVDLADCT